MSIQGQAGAQSAAAHIRGAVEKELEELNNDPGQDAAIVLKRILELCKKIEAEAQAGWY
jgi:hypothetical protein